MELKEAQTQQRLLALDPVALLHDGEGEKWEAIEDLDSFFQRVYAYYHERGLQCILASRITSLLTLAFTIVLFVFLVEMLDWHEIIYACVDDETCRHMRLIKEDALSSLSLVGLYYYGLFTLYWLWTLVHFLLDLRPLIDMHALFRDKLLIDDADLHVVAWDEVVVKIIELQRTTKLCIVKDDLTAHDIANRIMRKENFLIALVNRGLLPLQPLAETPLAAWRLPLLSPTTSLMSKSLEWNLYVTLLDAMFDKQFRIKQSFTHDVGALQRRFVLLGLLNLFLAPFFCAFMLVFLFLKHAEEFRRKPETSAFSRDYSRHSLWMFREFNELPHVFDARIAASHADAAAYVRQFPAPLTTLIARFVTFLVSSIAAALLLLSICNEKFLIFYRWPQEGEGGFNLLWWLALLSSILAVSRSFDGLAGEAQALKMQPDALLQSLALCTHYMPEHWRGRGHTRDVFVEFTSLYQYRVLLLLHEVAGALSAPLLLLLLLPARAHDILAFLRSFTVHVEGVGHVCSFALFDFERHGAARYGAPADGHYHEQCADGKLEKAYLSLTPSGVSNNFSRSLWIWSTCIFCTCCGVISCVTGRAKGVVILGEPSGILAEGPGDCGGNSSRGLRSGMKAVLLLSIHATTSSSGRIFAAQSSNLESGSRPLLSLHLSHCTSASFGPPAVDQSVFFGFLNSETTPFLPGILTKRTAPLVRVEIASYLSAIAELMPAIAKGRCKQEKSARLQFVKNPLHL